MDRVELICGDCLDVMRSFSEPIADVTITSPPYEDARTYGINFKLKGQTWVDWCVPRVIEMCRVTDGLVFFNAAGKRRDWKYSPVVEWLVTELTKNCGIVCGPAPYVFHRIGIPGSGSGKYHRRDWEPVYVFARPECVPPKWTDNTAMGHKPKWGPGGEMSNRLSNGSRVNQWGPTSNTGAGRKRNGALKNGGHRPSHVYADRLHTKTKANGEMEVQGYSVPAIADPGNVIRCIVGGGHMGSKISHENEACFPEELPEFFIRSYCPPNGRVFDPCMGSGTTAAVAVRTGRRFIGCDIRQSEIEKTRRRLKTVQVELFH